MEFVEGTKVPLKVHGIPVAWAIVSTNEAGDRIVVTWENGQAEIPLPVFDYEANND